MTLTSSTLSPIHGAIVVGASSGIGEAMARRLAREGYSVALVARRVDRLNAICDEINAQLGTKRAFAYPHDVTHFDEVPTLFQTILRDLERIKIVVYSSGVMPTMALNEYNFEKDRLMIDVNVLGAIAWLNQAAILFDRLGSGHIVGISSVSGVRGRVVNPGYGMTKAALTTYLESLRNRLTRKGVHVLTVKPGFVDTDMFRATGRAASMAISSDQAAGDIWKAIRARKQILYTPARWAWIMLVIRYIPSFIFRRLSI
ncbi:MAG: SDR family NAD(P)-dependent oxidoreductase [Chloroflexi bacterium]|nr:SDR family NAD(P)-dependent oxidoreductase [Chloroflexota bacterium]